MKFSNPVLNHFIDNLIEEYGEKRICKLLKLNPSTLHRIKSGKIKPPHTLIDFITKHSGPGFSKAMLQKKRIMPAPPLPNIRKTVTHNAFFNDQFEEILFTEDISKYEKDLISFFYLIDNDFKSLNNLSKYEILPYYKLSGILNLYERDAKLNSRFKKLLGEWFFIENKYYFQNINSRNNGIKLIESLDQLEEEKENEDKMKLRRGKALPYQI